MLYLFFLFFTGSVYKHGPGLDLPVTYGSCSGSLTAHFYPLPQAESDLHGIDHWELSRLEGTNAALYGCFYLFSWTPSCPSIPLAATREGTMAAYCACQEGLGASTRIKAGWQEGGCLLLCLSFSLTLPPPFPPTSVPAGNKLASAWLACTLLFELGHAGWLPPSQADNGQDTYSTSSPIDVWAFFWDVPHMGTLGRRAQRGRHGFIHGPRQLWFRRLQHASQSLLSYSDGAYKATGLPLPHHPFPRYHTASRL